MTNTKLTGSQNHCASHRLAGWLMSLFCIGSIIPAWAVSPTLVPQTGVTAPASIAELARSLKNDVDLMFEYVYTNIDYSPTFGVKKGALGTLLDGRGNDFDQSALLVVLLRQAGYTANYIYGTISLTPAQLNGWLGVEQSSPCPTFELLQIQGGIPASVYYTYTPPLDCSTAQMIGADIAHVWVSVTGGSLGAATRVYDPSFKTYTTPVAAINLASAMGYNQSGFLAAAKSGTTLTGTSIRNVNSANIQGALTGYANSLVNYIRTNMPAGTLNDVIGGKYIQPLVQPHSPQSSLPYGYPVYTWSGDIPNGYRTTMRVQIGGIDETYYADDIYGHRLTVRYNASFPSQPVLYLDGTVQGTGTSGATTLSYMVDFPFCFATTGAASTGCGTIGGVNYTNQYTPQNVLQASANYTYAIVNGWDYSGRGMLEFHRRQLLANQASGASDSSEAVLGEALNMIGYSWLAQLSTAADVGDRMGGTKFVTQSAIGVVGQVGGPYIDIPGVYVGSTSLDTTTNRAITAYFSNAGHGSAFEWGTLDQNLLKGSIGAVSTVKLFDIANTNNLIVYDATASNWTSGTNIRSLLTGYAAGDLSTIDA